METPACLACGATDAEPVITTGAHMMVDASEEFTFVACRSCGLVRLSPRVGAADLGRYYPDYYLPYRGASAWGRFAAVAERGMRATDGKRVRIVRRALAGARRASGDDTPARILDVGCGQPSFLARVRDALPGLGLTGIDFVDSGWRDDPARWRGLDLHVCEPAAFQPPSGSTWDVITMWHYLEHDYNPRKTLAQMRGLAHEQTRLLIEVPDVESLSRRRYGRWWEGWHAPRHTALYSRTTLTRVLAESGWRVERYTKRGTLDIYALWWMSAMERRGIDWRESMEARFPAFLAGRILTAPLTALLGWLPLGVQLVTAVPDSAPPRSS